MPASTQRLIHRLIIAALIVWVSVYVITMVVYLLHFNTTPADGGFQALNPLRRIVAGQYVDFFHGKGTIYAYLPIFWLFGRDLAAVSTTYVITDTVFFIGLLLPFVFVVVKSSHARLYLLTFLLYFLSYFTGYPTAANRAFLPTLAFVSLISKASPRTKAVITGICLGVEVLMSSDQFLAMLGGIVITLGILLVLHPRAVLKNFRWIGLALCAALVSGGIALFALNGSLEGIVRNLRYNYVELLRDQLWYFGAPPFVRPYTFVEFLFQDRYVLFMLLALSLLLITLIRLRKTARYWRYGALAFLLIYGMISTLSYWGMSNPVYFSTISRVNVFVIVVMVVDTWSANSARFRRLADAPGVRILKRPIFTGLIAVLLLLPYLVPISKAAVYVVGEYFANQSFTGGYLSPQWQTYFHDLPILIDAVHPSSDPPVIWSDFMGAAQYLYGTFNPAPADHIWHALGEDRRREYVAQFAAIQPEFVETMSNATEVFQDRHWGFYERVWTNYTLIGETPESFVWQRRADAWQEPAADCSLNALDLGANRWQIPTPSSDPIEDVYVTSARIRFRIENPLRRIPILGSVPRYLMTRQNSLAAVDTPLSLPPYATGFTFPVVFRADQTPILEFSIWSWLPGAVFQVDSVCLVPLLVPPENLRAYPDES